MNFEFEQVQSFFRVCVFCGVVGYDGNMLCFFIHVGGIFGFGVVFFGMCVDFFLCMQLDVENGFCNVVNDFEVFIVVIDGGECVVILGVEGQEYCVCLVQGGIVVYFVICVVVGYYVLFFFGIVVWVCFVLFLGQGMMFFLIIGVCGELQVILFVEIGFHVFVFVGGGVGQVQIQLFGNGQNVLFIISGLGNIIVGGYVGYCIMCNFGFVGEIDFFFQVLIFFFDIDIMLNLVVMF